MPEIPLISRNEVLTMPMPSMEELVDPARCVLVTQEMQGGVVGPEAGLPQLADEARQSALPNIGRLLAGARAAHVPVVHCLVEKRPDGKGSNENCRLFQAGKKFPVDLSPGSPGASLLPEFGPDPGDVVLTRSTGLGPMGGTDLDSVLRNLGARTVVATGVSVNVAIPNLVMDAVNHGYWVVLPRDAVAGVPREYAESIIDNTLSLLAHVVTTDAVLAAWAG
jgi:nicotinamidase-related amidase